MRAILCGAVALSVVACSAQNTSPSQIATDVNLVASGLSAAVTQVAAIPGINPTVVAQLQADLALIQKDAAQVAADTAAPSASLVQEIASTVQAVATVALPLVPGGAPFVPVIQAAVSMLPTLLAAVHVSGAAPVATAYTPNAARLILMGASK